MSCSVADGSLFLSTLSLSLLIYVSIYLSIAMTTYPPSFPADIFEVMPGHDMPSQGSVRAFMSSSLQISPGISQGDGRPTNGRELNASTDRWWADDDDDDDGGGDDDDNDDDGGDDDDDGDDGDDDDDL